MPFRIREVDGSIPFRSTILKIAAVKTAAISHLTTWRAPIFRGARFFVYSGPGFEGHHFTIFLFYDSSYFNLMG